MSNMRTVAGLPAPSVPSIPGTNKELPEDKLPQGRHATMAQDKTTDRPPSRFSLRMSAGWWRGLQCVGMALHSLAPPRPPSPAFTRSVPSTLSQHAGEFKLHFYLPKHYHHLRGVKGDRHRFPAVVNFHGGGFTIGNGTDDARFARFVLERCGALFVSVDYRLAPENPFPTAVDDAADAVLYLARHAAELRIDPMKMATCGFSAGGNLALTAPIRLHAHVESLQEGEEGDDKNKIPDHRLVAAVAWYPITDYTLTRRERRESSVRPEQTLPPTLTNLFDAAYLYPPELDLSHPCLSPSKGSDDLLARTMPPHVLFYTCEWDMLLQEGEALAKRLSEPPIARDVRYRMIEGVPHGWDKGPDPTKPPVQSEGLYRECCDQLREIFGSG